MIEYHIYVRMSTSKMTISMFYCSIILAGVVEKGEKVAEMAGMLLWLMLLWS